MRGARIAEPVSRGPEEQENQSRSQARYQGRVVVFDNSCDDSPGWPLKSNLNDPETDVTVPVSRLLSKVSVSHLPTQSIPGWEWQIGWFTRLVSRLHDHFV